MHLPNGTIGFDPQQYIGKSIVLCEFEGMGNVHPLGSEPPVGYGIPSSYELVSLGVRFWFPVLSFCFLLISFFLGFRIASLWIQFGFTCLFFFGMALFPFGFVLDWNTYYLNKPPSSRNSGRWML